MVRAERSSSGWPTISSSRLSCMETADCVRFSWAAALVTPPASATVTKERSAVMSRFRAIYYNP